MSQNILDFPVFCSDGIFWSNKVVLAALAPFLRDGLEEDSCVILPDVKVNQFKVFHANLFSKRNLTSSECGTISSVGKIFGLEKYSEPDSLSSCHPQTLDYQKIFRKQREEYFCKVYGNQDMGQQALRLSEQRRRKPLVSEYLNDILCKEDDGQDSIECLDCGRTFEDSECLNSHRSIVHSNSKGSQSKSYPCRFCSKKFSYLINLRRHTYLVHPNANEREQIRAANREKVSNDEYESDLAPDSSYKEDIKSNKSQEDFPKLEQLRCKICGEFLKSKRYLVAHIQTHYGGGYRCDYPGCTSVFKENAKLKRHKLVHTGEKAFKCDYCGLSFSLRHNLKTHEKTHTRRDLLKCRYCKYETIQKCNLRLHEATHERAGLLADRTGKGRPQGRQSRKIIEAVELLEKGDTFDQTEDQIEEFMKKMDQTL